MYKCVIKLALWIERYNKVMGNFDLQMQYLQETYKKLERLGWNHNKATWLVKNNNNQRLFVWKEIELEMTGIYQKLQTIFSRNLVSISEIVRVDDKVIVVIEEYVSGATLEELIPTGKIDEKMAVDIVRQLLEVLSILHGQNIIHRDINPKNVLLSTDGVVKLLDFGIARETKEYQDKDTTILGTAGYAAPEQYGFQQTDGRTDIYSLGVLFHVMLTKKLPEGSICQETKYQRFIQKCISLDPNQRYQSTLEAYRDLDFHEEKHIAPAHTAGNHLLHLGNEKSDHIEVSTKNPYIPAGFRSNVLWKKILAGCFYVIMGIYMVGSIAECAKTPIAFVLEFIAVMVYLVLSFVFLTNYGDWIHRIWPFSRIKRKWEMFVRVTLFIAAFYYGYTLEMYVRVTMLGLKP